MQLKGNIRKKDVDQYGTITGPAAEISAFQSPTFSFLACFGTKTPQTAELQSIYNCSIMEDVATCERPGTQHMNANKLYSHTENERREKAELCFCHSLQFDDTSPLHATFLLHLCSNLVHTSLMRKCDLIDCQ